VTPPPIMPQLRPLLPEGTDSYVEELLGQHRIDVRVSRPRRTKLGDHRPPVRGRTAHRITINDDLNPYAFLTTLLHEIAHAFTWERHRPSRRWVRPHGSEWKQEFEGVVAPVVASGVLPDDLAAALATSIRNPAAATCSDRGLLLALARYDRPDPSRVRVEELAIGTIFRTDDGMLFRTGPKIRTRRQCFECRTGREYRVHGLARVVPVEERSET
jgi:SprT protein